MGKRDEKPQYNERIVTVEEKQEYVRQREFAGELRFRGKTSSERLHIIFVFLVLS